MVYFGAVFFLSTLLGGSAAVFALILALPVWLALFRASFDTGWRQAIGIAFVAWIFLILLDVFLVQTFGVGFPRFYPFQRWEAPTLPEPDRCHCIRFGLKTNKETR